MKKLKIVHLTTWAPSSCGLTESSFNIAKADILMGHDVHICDTGINADLTKKEKSSIGEKVRRGNIELICESPLIIDEAELICMHTYMPDQYLSYNQASIVYFNHGRPEATYLQEFEEPKYLAYTAYGSVTYKSRVKKMVYFWSEFNPYWEVVCNKNKLVALDYPPIDDEIYKPDGIKYKIPDDKIGKINGLICDGNRRDINRFDLFIGAYHAAKEIPGLKWHFIGFNNPINAAEQRLMSKIAEVGGLGMVIPKVHSMDHFYRAMDFVYTPQRIITQIIAESIKCGIKVIGDLGCRVASQEIDIKSPLELIDAIKNLNGYENKEIWGLRKFGEEMNKIYQEVING